MNIISSIKNLAKKRQIVLLCLCYYVNLENRNVLYTFQQTEQLFSKQVLCRLLVISSLTMSEIFRMKQTLDSKIRQLQNVEKLDSNIENNINMLSNCINYKHLIICVVVFFYLN